jgi:hypothetical protein
VGVQVYCSQGVPCFAAAAAAVAAAAAAAVVDRTLGYCLIESCSKMYHQRCPGLHYWKWASAIVGQRKRSTAAWQAAAAAEQALRRSQERVARLQGHGQGQRLLSAYWQTMHRWEAIPLAPTVRCIWYE